MSLAQGAISSMNYFFLRHVTKKDGYYNDIVNNELENFVTNLFNCPPVDEDTRDTLAIELDEGDYFTGMTETEVRELLDTAIEGLVGEPLPKVTDLYVELAKERGILENEELPV